jgi:exonuclease-1
MGVTGLLPCLVEIQEKGSLERYRGKTLAIDTFGWLHRGLISCAQELCLGQPTRKYITSIMNKVQMLRHFGVEPYFVFDGSSLPTKAATNAERRKHREEARAKADALIKLGNRKLAWKEFMKAACVTSQMVKSLIIEFDNHGIKYVIAPYEADPQMVYLEKIGLCDGILSEDSDLLVFGCTRLITKLKDDGTCIEINRNNFGKVKKIPSLSWYSEEHLRLVAMLSGCDYTKGINGVGIQTAFKLVRKYMTYDKVMLALQADGKSIPDEFNDEYIKANLAFQFQKVFNPSTQIVCPLNDYPTDFDVDIEMLELCCGNLFTNQHWQLVCNGHIDPNSHELLVSREQSLQSLGSNSVYISQKSQSSFTNTTTIHKSHSTTTSVQKSKLKTVLDYFSGIKSTKSTQLQTSSKTELVSSKSTSLQNYTSSSTSSVSSTTSTSSQTSSSSLKRSNQTKLSPTSRKLKRIANDKDNDSHSNYFNTIPNLKHTSLPVPLHTRKISFGEESDFTDECSSPIKTFKQPSVNTLGVLTDNDEDSIISDDGLQSVVNSEELKSLENTKSTYSEKTQPDLLSTSENEAEDVEESPIKKSNDTSSSIHSSKLFNFCQTLRTNFLFDPEETVSKRKPLARVDSNKPKVHSTAQTSSTKVKTENTKKASPLSTKLADFAFKR